MINTLRYAERARNIKNSAVRNLVSGGLSSAEAAALRKENQQLKLELAQLQDRHEHVSASGSVRFLPSLANTEVVTRLAQCSSFLAANDLLKERIKSHSEEVLEALLHADKWQAKFERAVEAAEQHGVDLSDKVDIGNAESIVNQLHNQLSKSMSMNQDVAEKLDVAQRSSKRPRVTDDEDAGAAPSALPPDAWANVMEYLPLADVMSLSSTSKSIHDDASPLVKTLHIMNAYEMNPNLSKKFRNVRDIFIYLLGSYQRAIVDDDDEEDEDGMGRDKYIIDYETSMRAVPFLSNNFSKLERVFFGSTILNGELRSFINRHNMDRENWITNRISIQNMSALIDSISAAFRCGALSPDLVIKGLCCLQNLDDEEEEDLICPCCPRAARSWPIKSVVTFECEGSSDDQIGSLRSYDLDVCIGREDLERIVETRRGGHELLHSKFRLLNLLGKGRREFAESNGLVCLACYSDDQLIEIKRVFEYSKITASDLVPSELSQCMMKSLYSEMLDPTPSSFTSCLLSVYARDRLNADLKLTFEEEDAEQFRLMALGCLDFLVNGVDGSTYGDLYEEECLSILHRLVSIPNPPVRKIADSSVLPSLLTLLKEGDDGSFSKLKSAQIIVKLLVEGSRKGHANDYNDVTSLCNFLLGHESSKADLKTATFLVGSIESIGIECAAMMVLAELAKNLDVKTVSALVEAGLATNTIQFLNQNCCDTFGVKDAIEILEGIASASKELLWAVLDAGVMSTISSSRDEDNALSDEWVGFLSEVISHRDDTRLLQEIVEHVKIDCLVNTITIYSRSDCGAILILSNILAELKDDSIIPSAVESGVIAAIESTIFSANAMTYSTELSLETLTIIARHSAAYQDAVFNSSVLDQVSAKLMDMQLMDMEVPILSFLDAMSLRGKSSSLVGKIIELGFAPVLARVIAFVEDNQLSFAVETLLKVTQQDISTINGIVDAGLVRNLVEFLYREQPDAEHANAARNALVILQQISEYSPCYRDEVVKSIFDDLLCSGVKESCVETRSKWLALIHSLVAFYTPSTKAIHIIASSGVTEVLLDSMEVEEESIRRRWVIPILLKTRDCFVQILKSNIDSLEGRKPQKQTSEWIMMDMDCQALLRSVNI